MNSRFDLSAFGENVVYVKAVAVADLPQEVQEQVGDLTSIFSVHDADGQQLALVADRALAFALARQHDKNPVMTH